MRDHHTATAAGARWARGGFLYRFEARMLPPRMTLLPEGLSLTLPFDGRVVRGAFEGCRVHGTDHLLIREDGVGVVDAEKRIAGPGRELLEHVRGYCLPPAGLRPPPLEQFLTREFRWPTELFAVVGFSTFRGAAGSWAWLNRAIVQVAGWSSMATGRLAIETSVVDPEPAVVGPGQGDPASHAA